MIATEDLDSLSPELREAVEQYRRYGREVSRLELAAAKSDRDEDYRQLHDAIAQRNHWQGRVKELIRGRERELGRLLIG